MISLVKYNPDTAGLRKNKDTCFFKNKDTLIHFLEKWRDEFVLWNSHRSLYGSLFNCRTSITLWRNEKDIKFLQIQVILNYFLGDNSA